MPLIEKYFDEAELCRCGRKMREVHCVDCGSFSVERRTRPTYVEYEDNDGKKKKLPLSVYRCRRCGYKFTDKQRMECQAPRQGLSVKAQRVEDEIVRTNVLGGLAGLNEEQRKAKLAEMFPSLTKTRREGGVK